MSGLASGRYVRQLLSWPMKLMSEKKSKFLFDGGGPLT